MRNAFAHGGELTWISAFRAADFGVRLLAHFGDAEGAAGLLSRRESALPMMAEEQSISLAKAADAADVPTASFAGETDSAPSRAVQVDAGGASPDVFETDAPIGRPLTGVSARRQGFEPWHTVLAGPPSVIDELPRKAAKMQVRAVAAEIVDYEGPIALDRLARLVAAAFDWHRLTAKRIAQISHQIRQIEGISVDPDGFVWPQGVNPGERTEFRPQATASDREFTQISRREIANAARHLIKVRPGLEGQELRRAVIATFGRWRLTAVAAKHLDLAISLVR